jgi:hypothetical protein
MTMIRVIGVDPGLTTGIGVLDWDTDHPLELGAHVAQCDSGMAMALVASLIEEAPGHVGVAVERYVSGLAREGGAAVATRSLVEHLAVLAEERADVGWLRPAHQVKAWATEPRMQAAGLVAVAKGMANHGLDGLRHALYAACHDAGLPDPLGRRARAARARRRGPDTPPDVSGAPHGVPSEHTASI